MRLFCDAVTVVSPSLMTHYHSILTTTERRFVSKPPFNRLTIDPPVTVNNRQRSAKSSLKHWLPGAVLLAVGSNVFTPALAQDFDPVIEYFRLGASDMLVVNRGGPVSHAGDINGDGIDDVLVGAGFGSTRVIFGPNNGFDGLLDVTSLNGSNGFYINGEGPHLTAAGDLNADGVKDILIGSASGAHVVFGSASGFSTLFDIATLNGSNGFAFSGNITSVSDAGDINGDGLDDIIIGSAEASVNGQTQAGAAYVIYGSSNGFPASLSPADLTGSRGYVIRGAAAGDNAGRTVASGGDFNADGIDDILVGAPGASGFGAQEGGVAYVIYGQRGNTVASIDLGSLSSRFGLSFTGTLFEQAVGTGLSFAGDLNRDGIDDIAIGGPGLGPFGEPSDYPGRAFVLFGGNFATDSVIDQSALNGQNGFTLNGIRGGVIPVQPDQPTWGDMAGQSLDYAGDINGDGVDDLIIGASQSIINPLRKGNGQTYLVYGSPNGFSASLNLADLNGQNGFRLNGIGTTDYSGFSVSRAGDFSGDGIDDVIIGASGQGNSYVFYGRRTGNVIPEDNTLNAPLGVRAELLSATSVEISWLLNRSDVIQHEVYRDASLVASLDGSTSSFEDFGLNAGQQYQYQVITVISNGERSAATTVNANLADFSGVPVTAVTPVSETTNTPVTTPVVTVTPVNPTDGDTEQLPTVVNGVDNSSDTNDSVIIVPDTTNTTSPLIQTATGGAPGVGLLGLLGLMALRRRQTR